MTKPVVENGILQCQVHCMEEESMHLEDLGIPGLRPAYEWKWFHIDLDAITAMGEFEDHSGDKETAIYLLCGNQFVVNYSLKTMAKLWVDYKKSLK